MKNAKLLFLISLTGLFFSCTTLHQEKTAINKDVFSEKTFAKGNVNVLLNQANNISIEKEISDIILTKLQNYKNYSEGTENIFTDSLFINIDISQKSFDRHYKTINSIFISFAISDEKENTVYKNVYTTESENSIESSVYLQNLISRIMNENLSKING